jgi:uncharacterized protein (DUF2267 family)
MLFEQYCEDGRHFVNEVATELKISSNDQAARIMTAVLHTIRDLITIEESLDLISQLPMLIKAIYINGWKPKQKNRVRTLDDFVERLMLQNPKAAPDDFGTDEKSITRTKGVIKVLRRYLSTGEVKDIVSQMPDELATLWLTEKEAQEKNSV